MARPKSDPFSVFPLWLDRWRGSSAMAEMSSLARLAYIELCAAQWTSSGREKSVAGLPARDGTLARLSTLEYEEWLSVREEVLPRFLVGPEGRLFHPTVVAEVAAKLRYMRIEVDEPPLSAATGLDALGLIRREIPAAPAAVQGNSGRNEGRNASPPSSSSSSRSLPPTEPLPSAESGGDGKRRTGRDEPRRERPSPSRPKPRPPRRPPPRRAESGDLRLPDFGAAEAPRRPDPRPERAAEAASRCPQRSASSPEVEAEWTRFLEIARGRPEVRSPEGLVRILRARVERPEEAGYRWFPPPESPDRTERAELAKQAAALATARVSGGILTPTAILLDDGGARPLGSLSLEELRDLIGEARASAAAS